MLKEEPEVLDLCCGSGGAAVGIKKAMPKANITGIDINPQPFYPYEFIQADVLTLTQEFLSKFDIIWVSVPCQCYSYGTVKWRNQGKKYPDLVAPVREMLIKTGKPFIMENVVGSPLRKDLVLCGEMFGLQVIRHRVFEIHGFKARQLKHLKHKNSVWQGTAIGVWSGGKPGCFGNEAHRKYYATVAGHGGYGGKGNHSLKRWQEAMGGMDWVKSKDALKECVPPAYSEYILKEYLNDETAVKPIPPPSKDGGILGVIL